MSTINVFKFSYTNVKTGESWVTHILATNREDAENLLKVRVPFVFSIQYVEHLNKIDAVSTEVYNMFYESCIERYKQTNLTSEDAEEAQAPKSVEKSTEKTTTPKKSDKKSLKRKK